MKKFFLFITVLIGFLHASADFDNTEEFFVKVDGAELFCKMMGEGDPIVVIQGGPGLPPEDWILLVSKLAEKNSILFFDHRGSCRSTGEVNSDTMKFDVFVEDVESLRKSLGFTRISLLGDCWGGGVAMRYAIAYPEFVDKLVLLNTFPPSFEDLMVSGLEFKSRIEPYREEIHAIRESQEYISGDPDTLLRMNELNLIPHFYKPEKAKLFALQQRLSLQGITDLVIMRDAMMRTEYSKYFDWHRQLQELKNPTLIVCGDKDWIPTSSYEKIHKSIPNSKLIVLKNCGHITLYEKPDEVLEALKVFFYE